MSVSGDYTPSSPPTPLASPRASIADESPLDLESSMPSVPVIDFPAYEHPDSARYDTLPSTRVWSSPNTRPIIPEHSNSYERTCKIAAIVAVIAVMIIFTSLITGWGAFLLIPMVFIIGVAFLVYILSTVSTNNAQSRPRSEYPPYPGFELRPMA